MKEANVVSEQPLTHLDAQGNARMVDVGDKDSTHRIAVAQGRITMAASTADLIRAGGHKKGDVIAIARIAGIQGAKQCSQLIPPLPPANADLRCFRVGCRIHVCTYYGHLQGAGPNGR